MDGSYQLPVSLLASILTEQCVGQARKGLESEWLARDNLEMNPITIKPVTASHKAEQSSWVPSAALCPGAASQ